MKLIDLIGNTRLVELQHIPVNKAVRIYGKLEGDNPGGSVKDRAAYGMIKGALDRGDIKPGDRLVEATSGNTGIALAMIARIMNVQMTLVMPDNSTRERVLAMEAYGARVILTPSAKTIEYSRELAEQMAANEGYYMLNQFANADNYKMHYGTTGPEIWRDTGGKVTHRNDHGCVTLPQGAEPCRSDHRNPAHGWLLYSRHQKMVAGVPSEDL
jgi:S-sulfo-L-cysteine synthase (O-acetyl-L-serine-dependent)